MFRLFLSLLGETSGVIHSWGEEVRVQFARQEIWSSGFRILILFLALPLASFMTRREISLGVASFGIYGLIRGSRS